MDELTLHKWAQDREKNDEGVTVVYEGVVKVC